MHLDKNGFDLAHRKNNREWSATASRDNVTGNHHRHSKNVTIQKQERVKRLVLRRGTHVLCYREICKKCRDLCLPHVPRMLAIMKQNVPADPVHIRLLRSPTVSTRPHASSNTLHQTEFALGFGLPTEM